MDNHDHPDKVEVAERLSRDLIRAATFRRSAAEDSRRRGARDRLRAWQAERLARSYPDLLADERYGPAAQFFLSDLYGPKDFSERDREVERLLPLMIKALPVSGLATLALAVELDALSEELDAAMSDRLPLSTCLDDDSYAAAYRCVGRRSDRLRQIELIGETGEALEKLARKPLVAGALKLMHGPAHMAGLGELHDFLERGFFAFRHMGRADEFLERIGNEERRLMTLWLAP